MSKLYVPSKSRTSLDCVREDLDQAESAILSLRGAGPKALEILHLFDQIEDELHALELRGVDVRVERTRFDTMQRQLIRRKRRFLKQASRSLQPVRESIRPPQARSWWYLDEAAAQQTRRMAVRLAVGSITLVAVLVGAWLVYNQFLAPPQEEGLAFRRVSAGKSQVEEGNLRRALQDFDAATQLTPNDPEPWLWKGVLHDRLGEPDKAENALAMAATLYETAFDAVLNRGRVYLQVGDVEQAGLDAQAAIKMEPESGWGYYLRAGVAAAQRDYVGALADLERAGELAAEQGDTSLQAMAATQRGYLMKLDPMASP